MTSRNLLYFLSYNQHLICRYPIFYSIIIKEIVRPEMTSQIFDKFDPSSSLSPVITKSLTPCPLFLRFAYVRPRIVDYMHLSKNDLIIPFIRFTLIQVVPGSIQAVQWPAKPS